MKDIEHFCWSCKYRARENENAQDKEDPIYYCDNPIGSRCGENVCSYDRCGDWEMADGYEWYEMG